MPNAKGKRTVRNCILCVAGATALLSCAAPVARSVASPPAPALPVAPQIADQTPPDLPPSGDSWAAGYIDLQADWRLRLTVPLLRSGGYQLKATAPALNGNTISLSADKDLEGLEIDFYSVQPREGGGVRIEFVYGEVSKNDQTIPQSRPGGVFFQPPPNLKFLRLVYSVQTGRGESDHGMAFLAADEMSTLETSTRKLQINPNSCNNDEHNYCSWIPAGVAVVPQVRTKGIGADTWDPVR
jgi:hypothetical protein